MKTNLNETLKKDGWVLVKNFFTPEEVTDLRESCLKSAKESHYSGDLLSNKYLSKLFLNEKLMDLLKELIDDKPVYFGDSGYQIASVEGRISNGFHKDSVDRKNQKGLDWSKDYSIIRVGMYLQDHKNHSEGLVVRSGSHLTTQLTKGQKINVPSQAGDLIIWYLTTSHSGNAKRVKLFDYPVLMGDPTGGWFSHKLYYHLPKIFIQSSEKDRVAIFATFARKDKHLERYLNYLKHRIYMVNSWKKQDFSEPILDKIKAAGKLEVIDMKPEAKTIDVTNFMEYDFDHPEKFNI